MAAYSVVMPNQTIAGASTLVFIRAAAAASLPGASYIRILRAWCARRRARRPSSSGSRSARK